MKEGTTAQFHCNSKYYLVWLHNDNLLRYDGHVYKEGNSILISNAGKADQGTYNCIEIKRSRVLFSSSAYLEVTYGMSRAELSLILRKIS